MNSSRENYTEDEKPEERNKYEDMGGFERIIREGWEGQKRAKKIEGEARKKKLARKRELIQKAKEKTVKQEPQAATKLAVSIWIFAILLSLAGIMAILNLPQQEQTLQLEINLYYPYAYYYSYILHAFGPVSDTTVGILAGIRGREANIFFLMTMAGLSLPAGVGLLNRREWGWYLGLLQGTLTMLIGIYPILFFIVMCYLIEVSGIFILASPLLF
ncbi:MAG: hypothetical protein Q6366_003560 [Candidatus Freyarchaeota archaeon]